VGKGWLEMLWKGVGMSPIWGAASWWGSCWRQEERYIDERWMGL